MFRTFCIFLVYTILKVSWSGARACVDVPPSTSASPRIVQADNAPDYGVAQEVFHGVTIRHGENQEEEEGELEQEVEGNKEEKSNTSAHVHG